MNTHLNCLVVEDDPLDFQILEQHLQPAIPPVRCRRVARLADFEAALAEGGWDFIISDYIVPGQDIHDTLAHLRDRQSDLPVILVSGSIGEENAVALLKLGVADFVLKQNPGRLLPAIAACLREAAGRRARLAAEDRHRFLFDNMLNGCAYCRMIFAEDQPQDFIYLAVNHSFETLTGLKDVVGRRVSEVIPGIQTTAPELFAVYGRVARTRVSEKTEQYVAALGQWFALSVYSPAPDHFVAVFDVITERKQAEESLRRSQAVYHSLVTQLPVGIYQKDREGRYVVVNPTLCQLRGLPAAAFLGQLPLEVARAENEKAGPGAQAVPAALAREDHHRQILQTGRPIELEEEFILPDGRREFMHVMKLPVLDANGQVIGTQGVLFNVTERKRSEELLRESELQFRAMFETAVVGMAQADPRTGQFLRVNRKMSAITGYPEAELLRLRVPDITHPADRAADWELFQAVIRGERPDYRFEKRYVRQDGAVAWVNINMTVIRDAAGQALRTMAIIEDITERRRSEELLRESEQQFRAMFETAAVGMAQTDPRTGQFLRVNRKMCAITGYPEPELLRLRVPDITHPDDREANWRFFQANMADASSSHHVEKRYLRQDGTIAWVTINATVIRDDAGQPVRTLAVIEDITDRRLAEEKIALEQARFKLIFDSVPIGIAYAVVQPDGRYQRITNEAHLKICGLTPGEDSLPGIYQRITEPEDFDRQMALASQLGPDRVGSYTIEKRYRRPDGQLVWVAYSYKRQPQPDGSFADLTTVVDITERKLAEQALRESEMAFRTLAESMPQIVWSCNAEGLNVYFNQHWVDYTGLTLAESYGHGWNIPFHPEEQQRAWDAWQEAVKTGGTYALESRLRRADGVYRWWLIRGVPLRNPRGDILKWFGTCTDIDDLKCAEAALRTSRATLDAALASMTDAVFISDTQGEFLEFNEAFATFHKFKSKAECRRHLADYPAILDIYFPDGQLAPLDMWAVPRALRGEIATNAEYTIHRKDTGDTWTASCSFSPIRDAAGAIVGAVVVGRDVTARKQEEQAQRMTQFALEHSGDAVWWLAPDGRFLRANLAATRMVGYSLEELQSLFAHDLNPAHPPAAWARHWAELRQNKVLKFEAPARTKDGRMLTVEVTANYLEFEGREFSCAFVHDITERKAKTEELLWKTAFLESLVHSSADGILVVDNRRRKILQNQKLVDFWHLPQAVAANPDERQQHAFALTQARDPAVLEAQYQRVLANPEAPDQAEIELKDGTVLDRYTAQVRGKDGQVYGRVWTFHNITNARRLEAQYRQAQKMEAIGTLAGGIAHDFNNILCSMFGYGYLAQQETAGQALAHEYLAEILRAANRAKDLVQQILTFSRQREQKRDVIRLETILKEASKFLRASLPADLHLEINLEDDAPAVLADPTQIYQVVMNLATNALHAMEGRPGRLVLTLATFTPDESFRRPHPEMPPKTYVHLTMTDNGHGMDARTQERIFEPFFTTKELGKGTGLGLAVVHGIVQSHDGFITVASQPGQGATFDLYFPAQAATINSPSQPAGQLPRGAGQQILLLDDEPSLTGPFQGLLERLNYRVTCCNLPSEAIRRFRENPTQFDLIITDLTMPEISGLEVARQLHLIRADFPVILATGYAYSLSAATMKEAGICELLEKPLALAALAGAVQRALAKK